MVHAEQKINTTFPSGVNLSLQGNDRKKTWRAHVVYNLQFLKSKMATRALVILFLSIALTLIGIYCSSIFLKILRTVQHGPYDTHFFHLSDLLFYWVNVLIQWFVFGCGFWIFYSVFFSFTKFSYILLVKNNIKLNTYSTIIK